MCQVSVIGVAVCASKPHKECLSVPLGEQWQLSSYPLYTHLISRLPCSVTPSLHLAAGDVRGRGSKEKESHSTVAYLEPWQDLGILLCLSSEDFVHTRHLTLTAFQKCF